MHARFCLLCSLAFLRACVLYDGEGEWVIFGVGVYWVGGRKEKKRHWMRGERLL